MKEWVVVWVWLGSPWCQDNAWSLLRKFFLSAAFPDLGQAANWTVSPWKGGGTGRTCHTTSLCTCRWYGYHTRSDNNVGYHTCVFHTGAIKTTLALWYQTSDSTRAINPHGGFAYPWNWFHLCKKASVASAWGLGFQLKNHGTWYVSLDSNRSTSIGPNVSTILWNKPGWSFQYPAIPHMSGLLVCYDVQTTWKVLGRKHDCSLHAQPPTFFC